MPKAAACDLLVAGAGATGLWTALLARRAGLSVRVIEARALGAGASGGVLGALTPHAPDRWDETKAFQLAALTSLEAEIAALEAETGRATGYARVGRLTPLSDAAARLRAERQVAAAAEHWGAAPGARLTLAAPEALGSGLVAPFGALHDTLSARLRPAAYLAALAVALEAEGVSIETGAAVIGWDGAALLSDGRRIACGAVALAAGHESFALLERLAPELPALGDGVKGQAALFDADIDAPHAASPVIAAPGVFVVTHDDATVAVGSGDLADVAAPDTPDPSALGFLDRAAAHLPWLAGRRPRALWAGVRPRCLAGPPILGRLPIAAQIWIAGGGYKIGLGLAHRLAAAMVDRLLERPEPTPVPTHFAPEAHLAARSLAAKAGRGRRGR